MYGITRILTMNFNYIQNTILKKIPGKGGWTYAEIDFLNPQKTSPFGWCLINGYIDDYELKNYKLMPMKNGRLFLPVKAEIRKQINKKEGDWVNLKLNIPTQQFIMEDEIVACFKDVPYVFEYFTSLDFNTQKNIIHEILKEENEDLIAKKIEKQILHIKEQIKKERL